MTTNTDERWARAILAACDLGIEWEHASSGLRHSCLHAARAIRESDEADARGKRAATLIGEAIAESKIAIAAGGYDALGAAVMARLEASGMVLVPREATEAMEQAGARGVFQDAQYGGGSDLGAALRAWDAMIAAAPEADNG